MNIAIGYIGAKANSQVYSAKDALIDGAKRFAVGSGTALLAPVLGITTAITTIARIARGALTGMGTGFISNAIEKGTRIAIGDEEEWSNSQFAFSGLLGCLVVLRGQEWEESRRNLCLKYVIKC
ncbi:MAG: hypothetical protein IPG60_07655 [Bacteroidetes bacterium]|nr:hypothetical protein [Bacteroidota bacterium]